MTDPKSSLTIKNNSFSCSAQINLDYKKWNFYGILDQLNPIDINPFIVIMCVDKITFKKRKGHIFYTKTPVKFENDIARSWSLLEVDGEEKGFSFLKYHARRLNANE